MNAIRMSAGRAWKATAAGAAVLALTLATAGCEGGGFNKQTLGAGIGAVGGAAIGSTIGAGGGRTAAIIAGGLLGALLGSELGRRLDERDELLASEATQTTLERNPRGRPTTWSNPDSGHSGSVVADDAFYNRDREVCRQYTHTVVIDGRSEELTGVACRNPDGTWSTVNS